MAALNLFPARVAFVDSSGRLTPEAYRALNQLFARVGAALGDQGQDTFGEVFGAFGAEGGSMFEPVAQPPTDSPLILPDIQQPAGSAYEAPEIYQRGPQTHSDLDGVGTNTHAQVDTHLASTANPHAVTAAQAGADPAGTAAAAVATHEGEADPHPPYLLADGTRALSGTLTLKSYTIAAGPNQLPAAGTAHRIASVTDALAPTFLVAVVGGGAVKCPVYDNGTSWVAF